MAKQKNNSYGIASFVLSIFGLIIFILGLPLSILAIVFAKKQAKKYPNGITTTGLILGIIGTIISGLFWLLIIWAMLLS